MRAAVRPDQRLQLQELHLLGVGVSANNNNNNNNNNITTVARSVCQLSAEDTVSAGPGAVATLRGADFYQRGPCLERECCDTRVFVYTRVLIHVSRVWVQHGDYI